MIHLRSLKPPSLPQGIGEKMKKALPTLPSTMPKVSLPKVAPVSLPNIKEMMVKPSESVRE